ncbi:hypothetical protein O6H91_11G116600 [Diphasiastrum complanatum]|uniref:Uncharacterized protein n=1 Tax=Diphasiastrum complanatum TaxID=34168 RepID=A0ACC2CDN5_DIPCM|nr:hypothetical protein O6H91_11G116600 [Diphasiastrum complanatum]
MSYLKAKFLPRIKKFFEKSKKKGSSEAIKEFDSSKESISKELEERKGEIQPKVVEIYKSSGDKTKILLKDPSPSAIDADPALVQGLLKELATAGFPGATTLSDSVAKFGTAALAGPITFLLSKASVFVQDEPSPIIAKAIDPPISAAETKSEEAPPAAEAVVEDTAAAGETSVATETVSEESAKEVTNTDTVLTEVEKAIEKEDLAAAEALP